VAIAAKWAQRQLGVNKVTILDWDVHHGNGTQEIFYADPTVLFLSVHRDDPWYPQGSDKKPHFVGAGPGKGFNINCAFRKPRMGDEDYLSLWKYVFVPVIREFNPDLVFVSCGFDCAKGDSMGGMRVTRAGFQHMARPLLELAAGKVVFALEGGYHETVTAQCTDSLTRTLLYREMTPIGQEGELMVPTLAGLEDILDCIAAIKPYWRCVKELDENVDWQLILKQLASKLSKSRETSRPAEKTRSDQLQS